MDWMRQVDAYCERTDLSYWSEPVNALTNLAFLIAAVIMWRRIAGVPAARLLAAILFAIGVGSFLFHTHATIWASTADVLPIAVFILTYLFLINRDALGLRLWFASLATALFIPYAAAVIALLSEVPFFRVSSAYWAVPILIFAYSFALRKRMPELAIGMALGGALLCLSITLRSLDETLCAAFPIGTHFFWHVFNAIMLGWMIEVYRRCRMQPT